MENQKDKEATVVADTSAICTDSSTSTEHDHEELEKEVNEHFPLSGNETDDDLERVLSSDNDQ